jgi:predicted phage terminase large subunit-like protein
MDKSQRRDGALSRGDFAFDPEGNRYVCPGGNAELNDYSVCSTWSLEDDKFYLLDVLRQRLNYPDLKRAIISNASLYGSPTVVIEDKSSGTQLIQDLRNEGILDVVEYKPPPGADKILRLHACSDRFENGRVVLADARALAGRLHYRADRVPGGETRRPGRLHHPGARLSP